MRHAQAPDCPTVATPTLSSLVRGHPGALPLAFLPCAHKAGCQGMPRAEMMKWEHGRRPAGPTAVLEAGVPGHCPSGVEMGTVTMPS